MFPKNINNKPWNKWIDRLGGLEELGSRFTRRKKGEEGRLEGGDTVNRYYRTRLRLLK